MEGSFPFHLPAERATLNLPFVCFSLLSPVLKSVPFRLSNKVPRYYNMTSKYLFLEVASCCVRYKTLLWWPSIVTKFLFRE
jgi:hypothetical protein